MLAPIGLIIVPCKALGIHLKKTFNILFANEGRMRAGARALFVRPLVCVARRAALGRTDHGGSVAWGEAARSGSVGWRVMRVSCAPAVFEFNVKK